MYARENKIAISIGEIHYVPATTANSARLCIHTFAKLFFIIHLLNFDVFMTKRVICKMIDAGNEGK